MSRQDAMDEIIKIGEEQSKMETPKMPDERKTVWVVQEESWRMVHTYVFDRKEDALDRYTFLQQSYPDWGSCMFESDEPEFIKNEESGAIMTDEILKKIEQLCTKTDVVRRLPINTPEQLMWDIAKLDDKRMILGEALRVAVSWLRNKDDYENVDDMILDITHQIATILGVKGNE